MFSLYFQYLGNCFLTFQNWHMKAHYVIHLRRTPLTTRPLLFVALHVTEVQTFQTSQHFLTHLPHYQSLRPLNTPIFSRSLLSYPIRMALLFFLKWTLDLAGSLREKKCTGGWCPHSQAHKKENLSGRGLGK